MSPEATTNHDRRAEIIDSALRILDEEGVHALTLKRIAHMMDVSDAALFRHYRNKADIVNSMVDFVLRRHPFVDEGGDAWECLENIMRGQLDSFQSCPHHTSVLFQEELFRLYPDVTRSFLREKDAKREALKEILYRGIDEGRFPDDLDVNAFSLLFMGALRIQVLNWRMSGGGGLLADTDEVLAMLKRICEADDI